MRSLVISVALVLAQVAVPTLAWHDLQTTYRLWPSSSDKPPQTEAEAEVQGWKKIGSCCSDRRFFGTRRVQPSDSPDKVLIFNFQGQLAGIQSLVPVENFVDWDCSDSPYYLKDTIDLGKAGKKQFCVTTMYMTKEPREICSWEGVVSKEDHDLAIQVGANPKNVVHLPKTYDDVKSDPDHWFKDRYFLGMGHHVTFKADRDDCVKQMPIQVIYAEIDDKCVNTGFVWVHPNTNIKGPGWETPHARTVPMVIKEPPQCLVASAEKKLVHTMHIWLESSTTYCTSYFRR